MLLYLLWLPLITLLVSVNLAFVWNRSRRILTCHQVTRQWGIAAGIARRFGVSVCISQSYWCDIALTRRERY